MTARFLLNVGKDTFIDDAKSSRKIIENARLATLEKQLFLIIFD
jgi:hypothetical protein